MENQEYLVALLDGVKFKTTNINLNAVNTMLGNNKIFAVKLGNKSVQKQMIAFVAKSGVIEKEGKNVELFIANEPFYLSAENADAKVEEITNEVNANNWVLINNDVLFNRGCYQYSEEIIVDATQSID